MKSIIAFSLIVIVIFTSACIKDNNTTALPIINDTATYKVILNGTWKTPEHTIPPTDHFTAFIGLMHNENTSLYKLGALATKGVENIAEEGNYLEIFNEINAKKTAGTALNQFQMVLQNIIAKDTIIIKVNKSHALFSFISMIAPSPDWFVGIDSYNLIQNNNWISNNTININAYDAGTENGNVFGYNNAATNPQQNISLLTPANASVIANGNASIAPFCKLQFVKL